MTRRPLHAVLRDQSREYAVSGALTLGAVLSPVLLYALAATWR